MPETTNTATITVGAKVRLKAVQESEYLPQSLLDYLEKKGLNRADAVFTVTRIFEGEKDTMVDFAELDTLGGYYLRRFELADVATVDVVVQLHFTIAGTSPQAAAEKAAGAARAVVIALA